MKNLQRGIESRLPLLQFGGAVETQFSTRFSALDPALDSIEDLRVVTDHNSTLTLLLLSSVYFYGLQLFSLPNIHTTDQ